jgi:hypothetical protein
MPPACFKKPLLKNPWLFSRITIYYLLLHSIPCETLNQAIRHVRPSPHLEPLQTDTPRRPNELESVQKKAEGSGMGRA